ncbi:hypothetical protein DPM13_06735 [Paracoccus mutanolyticus]|uniref:histidine kinase n=1 Tax=Paracoccus mutanolyticus TaxID=1499308 RepID=A0ABM6WQR0_9RHOB|nr:hypothetical protein DPM13_06735 [Paracoccus mutanolyticus]
MTCRPSLRFRLWLGALLLAGLAVTAAGLAAWGLIRTQALRSRRWPRRPDRGRWRAVGPAERMAAGLGRRAGDGPGHARSRQPARGPGAGPAGPAAGRGCEGCPRSDRSHRPRPAKHDPGPAARPVQPAGKHLSHHPSRHARRTGGAGLSRRPGARRHRPADRPRNAPPRSRPCRHAILAPPAADRGGAGRAGRAPCTGALYLLVLGPLFRRLRQGTAFAATLSAADLPHGAGGHDELGLMFARLRQMAARIDRRRARLEAAIEERTAALSAANDRLALIDRNRRRFFADVGHELRTPLTVIMGEAELGEAHPDPEARAAFQTIGARAARLFRRIEDMLRIARSESGRLELAAERVDLGAAVRGALADLAPALKRAGVSAQVDLPPLAVRGDPDWLRQVFAGLFENAAKYAGRGAEVTVSGRADGRMALVRVADTGRGLPEGLGAAVLDRFTRDAQADQGGGFGVGLALARWVVETLGGSLVLAPSATGLALDLRLPLWEEE